MTGGLVELGPLLTTFKCMFPLPPIGVVHKKPTSHKSVLTRALPGYPGNHHSQMLELDVSRITLVLEHLFKPHSDITRKKAMVHL